MKKVLWSSVAAAALIFAGCSDQTKEDVKKAAQSVGNDAAKATETAKAKAGEAMEEAKRAAAEAVEKAKENAAKMEKAAKAKTAEVAESVEKKAAEVKEKMQTESKPAAQAVAPVRNGAALYAKCAGCHGADGKTKALGKSPVIAGQDAAALKKMLEEYKAGTRNAHGMGGLMKGQVAGLSESDIGALADYISKL